MAYPDFDKTIKLETDAFNCVARVCTANSAVRERERKEQKRKWSLESEANKQEGINRKSEREQK